jgi:hypothetical protein
MTALLDDDGRAVVSPSPEQRDVLGRIQQRIACEHISEHAYREQPKKTPSDASSHVQR